MEAQFNPLSDGGLLIQVKYLDIDTSIYKSTRYLPIWAADLNKLHHKFGLFCIFDKNGPFSSFFSLFFFFSVDGKHVF